MEEPTDKQKRLQSDLVPEPPLLEIARNRLSQRFRTFTLGISRRLSSSSNILLRVFAPGPGGKGLFDKSDDFRRAKRNLLWAAAATLLLAVSTGTTDIEAPSLSGIEISPGWLAIFLISYTLYLLWAFRHETYLLGIATSNAAAPEVPQAEDSTQDRVSAIAMRDLEAKLGSLSVQIGTWDLLLQEQFRAQQGAEPISKLKMLSGHYPIQLKDAADKLRTIAQIVKPSNDPRIQDADFQSRLSQALNFATQLEEESEEAIKAFADAQEHPDPFNELDIEKTRLEAAQHAKEVRKLASQVTVRVDDMLQLSASLDQRELRMFALHDRLMPNIFAIGAIVACTLAKWPSILTALHIV